MEYTPEQIAAAQAEALATIRKSIADYKAALPNARSDIFVVYTGTLECPVYINVEAIAAGRFSISLMHASTFQDFRTAQRYASRVQNGAGEKGHVIDQQRAFELEIQNRESLLALLSEKFA